MPMGTTDSTDSHAAAQLAALGAFFREHPVTGPGDGRRSPRTVPAAPLDLGTVDHIQSTVVELAAHVRAHNPDAGPLPDSAAAVYEWAREHTEHAEETVKRRHDVIVYRQHLEHAIRLGDTNVVRRHSCPGCGCVGLHWRPALGKAVCRNRRCTTRDGRASTWTLAHLAHQHIEAQEKLAARAT